MRGFSTVSDEERQQIKQQHSKVYDGYAIGNVPSNMTPLTVYDAAQDKEGITVTANGEVKTYRNHNINEIAAKNLHYDEIDPAYDFDSHGPEQNMARPNQGTKPYEFDSKGPSDPYYGGGYDEEGSSYVPDEDDTHNFDPLLDMEEYLDPNQVEIEVFNENVKKSLDMFKRFKKYN
jgi:hypothetical protein